MAAVSSLVAPAVGEAQAEATRIMPLGDSITQAKTGRASYRYWLWHDLIAAGHAVDFVGSVSGVRGGATEPTDIDQDHEGHWGWRADQVLAQIDGWTRTTPPQIVLLHLGTNDLLQGQSIDSTINELDAIIDAIRRNRPDVVVLFAQVIPSNRVPTQIRQLNQRIGQLAAAKSSAASRVIVVDQWTGFSVSQDTYDGIHPDRSGEKKMAARWSAALDRVLWRARSTTTTTAPATTAPTTTAPTTAPTTTAPTTTAPTTTAVTTTAPTTSASTTTSTTAAPPTTTTRAVARDTVPPSVAITGPADGSTVRRRTTVRITATASDDRRVRKVELFVDGTRVCTEWSSPYSCSFTSSSRAGVRHTIVADAFDPAGNRSRATVVVTTR